MMGRIMNEIGSYDYMDNEKYKRIEKLIEVMKENFGFQVEGEGTPGGPGGETPKGPKDGTSSEATDNEGSEAPKIEPGTGTLGGTRKRGDTLGRQASNKTVPKHSGSEFGTFSRDGHGTHELSKYN